MSNDKYIPIKPFFKSGKVNDRTKNIEWEHIMPAENFGRHLSCWKEGDLLFKFLCINFDNSFLLTIYKYKKIF